MSITGQGTGKTVICGLTDTFPLISLVGHPSTISFYIIKFNTPKVGIEGIYLHRIMVRYISL
jgi:hypothetical protein